MHGHAWIVETPEQWLKRKGTSPIKIPEKPEDNCTDMQSRIECADELEKCLFHHHSVQEGTDKLVAWFGKAMFLDLCEDGEELDAGATPTELLKHLEETC